MDDTKAQLRRKLTEYLLSLTKKETQKRSFRVECILSQLPIYKQARLVMAYVPLKGEVDIWGMIRKAWGSKVFCFPVMDAKTKTLRAFEAIDCGKDFIRGPYGVMEPDVTKCREVDPGGIDLILVPGVAFDRHKNRLGRGAGCYDRFLKNVGPRAKKVGVAFDFQILDDLPFDPAFDQKVDIVIGENGIF